MTVDHACHVMLTGSLAAASQARPAVLVQALAAQWAVLVWVLAAEPTVPLLLLELLGQQ